MNAGYMMGGAAAAGLAAGFGISKFGAPDDLPERKSALEGAEKELERLQGRPESTVGQINQQRETIDRLSDAANPRTSTWTMGAGMGVLALAGTADGMRVLGNTTSSLGQLFGSQHSHAARGPYLMGAYAFGAGLLVGAALGSAIAGHR